MFAIAYSSRLGEFALRIPAESIHDCHFRKPVQRHDGARSFWRFSIQPARRVCILPVDLSNREANGVRMF